MAHALLYQSTALLPQATKRPTGAMGAEYIYVLRCQSTEQLRFWL